MKTSSLPSFVTFVRSFWITFCIALLAPTGVSAQGSVDYFAGFGSFEGGAFVSPLFEQSPFSGSSTAIPGWTIWASGAPGNWLRDGNAQDGDNHVILRAAGGSIPGSSSATFDFAISPTPFTVGELYELVFWAAGGVATSGVNRIRTNLSFSPIELPSYTQQEFEALVELEWQEIVVPFVAQAPGGEVRVSIDSIPASGTSSVYLDNFSIRPVP
jgi:hypothetical protein